MISERDIGEAADRVADEVIRIRRTIHQKPELGFEEVETAALVASVLDGLGIPHRTGVGRTGVVGLVEGAEPGPTLALRGDMDALPMDEQSGVAFASQVPGRMHACGHDAHTAILLGAAMVLAQARPHLKGRVKLIFQPAEELLEGARAMIDDGVLDDPSVDMAIGYHNMPTMEAGAVGFHKDVTYASADAFDVNLRGVSGHGAQPHLAVDVIAAASYFVTGLQTVVSREISPVHPAVVSIGSLHAGTIRNILPDAARIEGTIRTLSQTARDSAVEAIGRHLDGLKRSMRVDGEVEFSAAVPLVRNDAHVLGRVLESARAVVGGGSVRELAETSMASEDFAFFSSRVPSAHLRFGSRIEGLETAAHRSNYDCNELAITTGVKVVAKAAADLLS